MIAILSHFVKKSYLNGPQRKTVVLSLNMILNAHLKLFQHYNTLIETTKLFTLEVFLLEFYLKMIQCHTLFYHHNCYQSIEPYMVKKLVLFQKNSKLKPKTHFLTEKFMILSHNCLVSIHN